METRNVFIQVIKKPARNNMKKESHFFKKKNLKKWLLLLSKEVFSTPTVFLKQAAEDNSFFQFSYKLPEYRVLIQHKKLIIRAEHNLEHNLQESSLLRQLSFSNQRKNVVRADFYTFAAAYALAVVNLRNSCGNVYAANRTFSYAHSAFKAAY